MNRPALGRDELDTMMCSTPGCTCALKDRLFLHGACHPGQGNEVEYGKTGVLSIRCRVCKKSIVNIAVAAETITSG